MDHSRMDAYTAVEAGFKLAIKHRLVPSITFGDAFVPVLFSRVNFQSRPWLFYLLIL